MAKHEVSYESIEAGQKDGWKQIGGASELMRVIRAGWYAICERKLQNDKNTKIREMMKTDPRMKSIRDAVKKQLGGK
jgi:hypothetical protein